MILYTSGCSHTAGSTSEAPNLHGDCSLSWPNQLAQMLGYELVDHSEPGHSNGYILRKLTEFLMDGNVPDKVVIQWTHPLRVDLPMPDGSFQTSITTGESWTPVMIRPYNYIVEPYNLKSGWRLLATQSHQAAALLDKYGIVDYVFIFWRLDYSEYPHLDQMDKSKVITNARNILEQEGFKTVYESHGMRVPGIDIPDHHYGPDAHLQIAQWIVDGMSDKEFERREDTSKYLQEVYTGK